MPLASADVPGRGRLCGEPNKSLHRRQDDKGSGCNNDNTEEGDDTEEHMGRGGGGGGHGEKEERKEWAQIEDNDD